MFKDHMEGEEQAKATNEQQLLTDYVTRCGKLQEKNLEHFHKYIGCPPSSLDKNPNLSNYFF